MHARKDSLPASILASIRSRKKRLDAAYTEARPRSA
ncbi:EEP domain-containing protein, partial [Rhizobium ruizarguesonis]